MVGGRGMIPRDVSFDDKERAWGWFGVDGATAKEGVKVIGETNPSFFLFEKFFKLGLGAAAPHLFLGRGE
jgi:hypothetical protein